MSIPTVEFSTLDTTEPLKALQKAIAQKGMANAMFCTA